MSVILHASGLCFGKASKESVDIFHAEIERLNPDLLVLSGDFTQTASKQEFLQAKDFLKTVKVPVLCVPGNHDIPRYNLYQRFADPMNRYRDYIFPVEDSVYEHDSFYIVGINTARPVLPHWNWANGMVSREQVEFVYRQFKQVPHDKARILVCHHPLMNFGTTPIDTVVWGSTDLMGVLEDQQVDLVLTGHRHHATVFPDPDGRGPAMVGAGSATSVPAGGYNILRILPDKIDIELVHSDGKSHTILESLSLPRPQRGGTDGEVF